MRTHHRFRALFRLGGAVSLMIGAALATARAETPGQITNGQGTLGDDTRAAVHDTATKLEGAAFDLIDKRSATLEFRAGSTELTDGSARKLEALVKGLDRKQLAQPARVAVWPEAAPAPTPGKSGAELVADRLAVVSSKLSALGVTTAIQPVNVGGAPSREEHAIAPDAELQHYLASRGGPGKAVVVFGK